jgi:hypothetical protein
VGVLLAEQIHDEMVARDFEPDVSGRGQRHRNPTWGDGERCVVERMETP